MYCYEKSLSPIANLPTKEEKERLSRERNKIKFVNVRFESRQAVQLIDLLLFMMLFYKVVETLLQHVRNMAKLMKLATSVLEEVQALSCWKVKKYILLLIITFSQFYFLFLKYIDITILFLLLLPVEIPVAMLATEICGFNC